MAVAGRAEDLWSTFNKLLSNEDGGRDSRRFTSISTATKTFVKMIVEENFPGCNELGECFNYFKSKDLLNILFDWCRSYEHCTKETTFLLLDLYRSLFSTVSTIVLRDQFILTPFHRLLIDLRPKDKQKLPFDVEISLLSVVEGFITRLKLDHELLNFCSSDQKSINGVFLPKYTFFSTILYYLYIEGELGSMARRMLSECIDMSADDHVFADFIGKESSCCAILAAGLSGLFSTLPTSLMIDTKDWCGISRDDCAYIPDLMPFLEALHMCCTVAKVKHGNISTSLLTMIHDGFLVSVLTPALFQSGVESKTSTIAYIDLFLRTIDEPEILKLFLKWILLESYEDYSILDLLISHLYLPSIHLCMVTIHLFRTLVEFNCEDVIYHLILRYLIPCNHVLANQKRLIKELDFYCKSANMFLYLTPSCCLDASTIETTTTSLENDEKPSIINHEISNGDSPLPISQLQQFNDYLYDCRETIQSCKQSCQCWSSVYDGTDVMTEYPSRMSRCASHDSSSSDVTNSKQMDSYKEQLMLPDTSISNTHATDCLGPFMNAIFDKLEKMPENYPYVNLQLTALVSRLACYPQPLLRSFLLSSTVVLHKGVRSLIQTISTVCSRTNMSLMKLENCRQHLKYSRLVFLKRATFLLGPDERDHDLYSVNGTSSTEGLDLSPREDQITELAIKQIPTGDQLKPISSRTYSLTTEDSDSDIGVSLSFAPNQKVSVGRLHPVIRYGPKEKPNRPNEKQGTKSHQLPRRPDVASKNILYCAIILEEWLKELAAISLEHNLA